MVAQKKKYNGQISSNIKIWQDTKAAAACPIIILILIIETRLYTLSDPVRHTRCDGDGDNEGSRVSARQEEEKMVIRQVVILNYRIKDFISFFFIYSSYNTIIISSEGRMATEYIV